MYPNLFGVPYLHTYGLFVGLAIVTSMYVASRLGRQSRLGEKDLNRIFLITIIMGLVGGRLFYIIQNLSYYMEHPGQMFMINQGGLVVYGAILLGIGGPVLYMRLKKMPVLRTLDVLCISIPLGLGIGRIGCFSAGCCYGRPIHDGHGDMITSAANAPWYAVKFPEGVGSLAPAGNYLFPVQLMDAAFNITIFLLLLLFRKKLQKYDGQAVWLFLVLYGVFRSIAEIFRGDDAARGYVIQGYLSTSQAISIPLVLLALYMLLNYRKEKVTYLPNRR